MLFDDFTRKEVSGNSSLSGYLLVRNIGTYLLKLLAIDNSGFVQEDRLCRLNRTESNWFQ